MVSVIIDNEKLEEILFVTQAANDIQQMEDSDEILKRLERMKKEFVEKFMKEPQEAI